MRPARDFLFIQLLNTRALRFPRPALVEILPYKPENDLLVSGKGPLDLQARIHRWMILNVLQIYDHIMSVHFFLHVGALH